MVKYIFNMDVTPLAMNLIPDFYIALSRAKVDLASDVVFGPAYLDSC